MPEYKTHSFNKDWHDKVEKFLEDNDDLAFDSPKYFIKYCVNRFMEENSMSNTELATKLASKAMDNPDSSLNEIVESMNDE